MWAAAPVSDSLWVSSIGKYKPFRGPHQSTTLMGALWAPFEVRFDGTVLCPHTQTPVCIFVQERLPEMPAWRSAVSIAGAVVGHKLESLILAQNERWRHA